MKADYYGIPQILILEFVRTLFKNFSAYKAGYGLNRYGLETTVNAIIISLRLKKGKIQGGL